MTMAIKTITPDIAAQYLTTMLRNRKVRARHVETLALSIVQGQWQLNGETIKFNTVGELIDGQHRLLAVIKADLPIQSYVIHEIAEQYIDTIDVGLKRSAGDIFQFEGYSNATNLCASARWIWRYEQGLMLGYGRSATIDNLKAVISAHPEIKNSLAYGTLVQRYIQRSLGSALHCLFAEQSSTTADQLYTAIRDGEALERTNSVYLLRQRLIANMQAKAKLPAHEVGALVIKTFNAYRTNAKAPRFLRWRTSGDNPEPYPVIA